MKMTLHLKLRGLNSSLLGGDSDLFFISRTEAHCSLVWISSSLMLKCSKPTCNQGSPEQMKPLPVNRLYGVCLETPARSLTVEWKYHLNSQHCLWS